MIKRREKSQQIQHKRNVFSESTFEIFIVKLHGSLTL